MRNDSTIESLNHRQREFARRYRESLNATRAAIEAGYSVRTAYSAGQRLLKHHPVVSELLKDARRPEHVRQPRPESVYLIGEPHGAVKIGRSIDVLGRLRALQTGYPYPLQVLQTIRCKDAAGLEHELHARYAAKRLNGEWFSLDAGDLEEINRHANREATTVHRGVPQRP